MLRLLAPTDEMQVPQRIIASAMKEGDADFAKWAIERAQPEDCTILMKAVLGVESDEVYALWEEHVLTLASVKVRVGGKSKDLFQHLFGEQLFNEARDSSTKQRRVEQTLEALRGKLEKSLLGKILGYVARSSCSVPLTEKLLSLGAPIDFPRGYPPHRGMTALRAASRKTTREAADLMRCLLRKGADPNDSKEKDIRGRRRCKGNW